MIEPKNRPGKGSIIHQNLSLQKFYGDLAGGFNLMPYIQLDVFLIFVYCRVHTVDG